MILWIILVIYFLGWVYCTRVTAWLMIGDMYRIEGFDIFMGLIFGSIASLAWPVVAPLYWLSQKWKADYVAFLISPPRHVKKDIKAKQQAQKIKDQQYEIDRLERELGIAD